MRGVDFIQNISFEKFSTHKRCKLSTDVDSPINAAKFLDEHMTALGIIRNVLQLKRSKNIHDVRSVWALFHEWSGQAAELRWWLIVLSSVFVARRPACFLLIVSPFSGRYKSMYDHRRRHTNRRVSHSALWWRVSGSFHSLKWCWKIESGWRS